MSKLDNMIKDKLKESEIEVAIPQIQNLGKWNDPRYQAIRNEALTVMASYQNANRWLDTIKEDILINKGCPYFSDIVHQLAHKMPGSFDKFGDILHTANLLVPYPSTPEWTEDLPNIQTIIKVIFSIMDQIQASLFEFKKAAELSYLINMSIDCDQLIVEIANEYEFYYRVEKMLECYGDNLSQWDKRVYEYWNNKSKLV